MALHQKIGGVWKDCTPWVNAGGTWKKAAVWQRIGGVWTKITSLLSSLLPSGITVATDYPVNAGLTLSSAGTWSTTDSQSGTWMGGGVNSDYEARVTMISGTLSSGTTGTWLALSTSRTWSMTALSAGDRACSFTLEVRMSASPNTVLSTTTVSLNTYGTA